MGAKGYSAGAIFLQVVPVFEDMQRQIEREAKKIDRSLGDDLERSGDNAGRRAGRAVSKGMSEEVRKKGKISDAMAEDFDTAIGRMEKSMARLDNKGFARKDWRALHNVQRMKAELASIRDVDIKVDDNFEKVQARLLAVRASLKSLEKRSKIFIEADGLVDVYRDLHKVEAAVKAIDGDINLDVNTKPAERAMSIWEKKFSAAVKKAANSLSREVGEEAVKIQQELNGLHADIDLGNIGSAQAIAELDRINVKLKKLGSEDPNIDVNTSGIIEASAELTALLALMHKVDRTSVRPNTSGVDRSGRGATDAANSFRSFNAILMITTTIGPGLVPILGAIAGGLLALGPAAAVAVAGIGAAVVGFSGLSDAMSALQSLEDQTSTMDQTAAKSAENAARRVADARRSAAESVESALERQRSAQRSYKDSVDSVREAELALKNARKEATDDAKDLSLRIRQNKLALDQALLDSFGAATNSAAVNADGASTNAEREQARIDKEQALLHLEELRAEQKDLAGEKKKWDKEGADGTEKVKSAQSTLQDAIEAQKESYRDLGKAAEAVDKARAEGARNVARALEDQSIALDNVSSQQQAVDAAFAKLGPAGREFALFLFSLKSAFQDFRNDVQTVFLPSVQEAMEAFGVSDSAKIARDSIISLAAGLGDLAKVLSKSLQGEAWTGFFTMLGDAGVRIQDAYGKAFISFMEAVASILTTLAPYAEDFALGLQHMMETFAGWAKSKSGQEGLTNFMDAMKEAAPSVLKFIAALAKAFVAILKALEPWGEVILQMLTGFLDFLSQLDPKILAPFITAIIVLIGAAQNAYLVMNLVMALGALSGTFGVIVLIVGAVIAVLAALYVKNEGFRNFVKKAWKEISAAFQDAWKSIKPALITLWEALKRLGETLAPVVGFIADVLLKMLVVGLRILWKASEFAFKGIAWFITNLLIPGIQLMGKVFTWLWNSVIKPVLGFIVAAWNWLFAAFKFAWENIGRPILNAVGAAIMFLWNYWWKPAITTLLWWWKQLWKLMKLAWKVTGGVLLKVIGGAFKHFWEKGVKPVLDKLGAAWNWLVDHVFKPSWKWIQEKGLPKLKSAFKTASEYIGRQWEKLKGFFAKPIKFVIEKVINGGIIKGMNKIAGWVGADKFDDLPVPTWMQSYATGGIMPGYTPGRDVHDFYSPTAGRLALSGGEAIMRPEWTQAFGPSYVNRMNALARSGGVSAVRNAMRGVGSYWLGGVIPLSGAHISSHGDKYGHPAYDMSDPPSYGKPIRAWKSGNVAQMRTSYVNGRYTSYGRWAVLNHPGNESSLYAHMSAFAKGLRVGQSVGAGQTIGRVGSVGNSSGPHVHFEIRNGLADYFGGAGGGDSIPNKILSILKDPLGAIKSWIVDPVKNAVGTMADSKVFKTVTKAPLALAKNVADKVWDIVPSWAKAAAGWAGDAADWVVGGVKNGAREIAGAAGTAVGGIKSGAGAVRDFLGLADGGILPYNGAMAYDNGGYLPPGLTSVVNLTGRPEPVFTSDQWRRVGDGVGAGITYAPTFNASDLTASDVAGDLNFTFRRMRRSGKYAKMGASS